MSVLVNIFLIVILYVTLSCTFLARTVRFDQVVLGNSTYLDRYYNLTQCRIAKYNRTTYVLNYEIEMFFDLDENVFVEAEIYKSFLNNNQYTRYLYIRQTLFVNKI